MRRSVLFFIFLIATISTVNIKKTYAQEWFGKTIFTSQGDRIDVVVLDASKHNNQENSPNGLHHAPTLIVACQSGEIRVGVEFYNQLAIIDRFRAGDIINLPKNHDLVVVQRRFGKQAKAEKEKWKTYDGSNAKGRMSFIIRDSYQQAFNDGLVPGVNTNKAISFSGAGSYSFLETKNAKSVLNQIRKVDEFAISAHTNPSNYRNKLEEIYAIFDLTNIIPATNKVLEKCGISPDEIDN